MKSLKYIAFILVLAACDVERIPEDTLSDASFWRSENDLKAAANYMYTFLPIMPLTTDNWSDDTFATLANEISSGTRLAPATASDFNAPYQLIRAANNIIEKSPRALAAEVPAATVDIYVAEARFFRAWAYIQLVMKYGDVPLILKTLSESAAELMAPKNARAEVLEAVYQDLDFAASKLPTPTARGNAGYGRVTSTAALGLKAQVALFEGTRSKFHGYGEPQKHLTLAVAASKAVIDSKEHDLFGNYFDLFQYAGEGRQNKENILVRQYGKSIADNVISHNNGTIINGALNPTKVLIDSYLMKDGLPITKSPLYVTPTSHSEIFVNRDPRLSLSVMKAGDPYSATAPYTFPQLIYHTTGFCFRKFVAQTDLAQSNTSFIDLPVMRYAEILLIYAEAKYEQAGSISDADLDLSINRLRTRVQMPALTNAFVTTNALNMRDEIRRERRVELAQEGFRYWDLIRWKIAETELPKDVLGSYFFPGGFGTANPQLTADNFILLQRANTRSFKPSRDYLWPIPITELALNPALEQNKDW